MKHLTAIFCLTITLLLGSAGLSYALPTCPGSYNSNTWSNCFGTITYPTGNKYVGEWMNDKRNGQGTYTYTNGNKYVGEFENGKRHGQGNHTTASGNKYVGEWKVGKRNGQGTYTDTSGNKYVGGWKNGKKHGQGTAAYADGRVQEGIFKDNNFLYAQKGTPTITVRKSSPPSPSAAEIENQKLRKENDGIESRSSERSIASRLSILKELQDAGLITKAEAATKRKVILDSL
jgi:hypothetical protein